MDHRAACACGCGVDWLEELDLVVELDLLGDGNGIDVRW
jgi:hypothetical protein